MVTSAGPIAREPAQREARRELSRGMYHQTSVTQKIVHAISSFLNKIFSGAGHATPGGWWTLVALVAVVVLVVAVILTRTGPLAGAARRTAPPGDLGPGPLTARQCRAAAEEAAAGGDYGTAILQRLRAVAFSLEERRVLHPDTGRTADEVAAQAGARFPDHAAALADAARLFDRIRFGDGTGTRDGYERMKALDDLLARTAPAAPAQSPAAVPA
ncbi:MAG: DUF4129 domain-containing protein [Streptosporangiales bacterium]|nr:DUF4129 domain-containing protein [Streptosporangiales bacterium]